VAGLSNLAASVKARLRNRSQATGESFDHLLTMFAVERLLYRLSRSPHAARFVLKGAMLFRLWEERPSRPTRDLDLLGRGANDAELLRAVFGELAQLPVAPDGLVFAPETITVEPIREGATYHGQRVKLVAFLDRTKVVVQVDIGFGDAVVPPAEWVKFPVLLDFPAPRLWAYRPETAIAEKLRALLEHGLASSRVKDVVDLWSLARRFRFEGPILTKAVAASFTQSRTALPAELPAVLTPAFSQAPHQQQYWAAFLARTHLAEEPPPLVEVMAYLQAFL
jgi:hypothetical protein